MKNLFKELAKEIIDFNTEFGYTASKNEVANEVWHKLTSEQRYEIMQEVGEVKGTLLKQLRTYVKYIEENI